LHFILGLINKAGYLQDHYVKKKFIVNRVMVICYYYFKWL